jgi:integrase
VNIDDVESVKAFIAHKQVSEARKQILVDKYAQYCKWRKIHFDKPIYKAVKRLPFIPTEKEIGALISASGKKTSTFLQVLKETGARPGEAWALKWTDIDFKRRIVNINDPEKNSLPRTLKVSNKLIAMLNNLLSKSEFVFRENLNSRLRKFSRNFARGRMDLTE